MPSLIRFLVVVAVLAGLVYAGLYALANFVPVKPREITETIQLPKAAHDRRRGRSRRSASSKRSPPSAARASTRSRPIDATSPTIVAHLRANGAEPADGCRGADVRAYLAARGAEGLKASSLARRLSAIRQFHKHLYAEGMRTDDPTLAIEGPRRGRPLPKVLTVEDVARLIEAARQGLDDPERPVRERLALARMTCLVELIYASGLRVSEVLEPAEVGRPDAKEPFVAVRGKGGKERLAPMSNPARAAIDRLPGAS